jgi:hypothetical protein
MPSDPFGRADAMIAGGGSRARSEAAAARAGNRTQS